MCKVLLRNDYWCKGLGQTQPKSAAYEKFKTMKKARKLSEKEAKNGTNLSVLDERLPERSGTRDEEMQDV